MRVVKAEAVPGVIGKDCLGEAIYHDSGGPVSSASGYLLKRNAVKSDLQVHGSW